MAVAIALTFREDAEPGWFGPDFIAPGAKLPEAKLGERPPSAPVIHVSNKWVKVRGKRVAKADEVIRDPDFVVDGLYKELVSIADDLRVNHERRGVSSTAGDIIVQADRKVEFELLARVLYTCARAEYKRWNLAAVNPESRELEVVAVEVPDIQGPICETFIGIGPRVIERGDTVAVEYESIPEIPWFPPGAGQRNLFLFVGEDWFLLPDSNGGAMVGVRNIADYGYFVLRDKLEQIKRRYPEQKRLIIACDGRVKYEELIHIIEASFQPEIALTEIYLTSISQEPR